MKEVYKKKIGVIILILFSIPFAIAGVVIAYAAISSFIEGNAMKNWEEAPAKIIEVELIGSSAYTVKSLYEYEFKRERYMGNRVSFYPGSEGGSFYKDIYKELSWYKNTNKLFKCYVNPTDPAEAVLYRDIRWEFFLTFSVGALLFGGVGFGLMIPLIIAYFKIKKEDESFEKTRQLHPGKPWLLKKEWANGAVKSSTKADVTWLIIFTVFCNLMSLPLLFSIVTQNKLRYGWRALIALIFPLIGFILIGVTIKSVMRWRKFGVSVFQMAAFPGAIGGKAEGTIVIPASVSTDKGFLLTLNCINEYRSGSKNEITKRILWQDSKKVNRDSIKTYLKQSLISVRFDIPAGLWETNEENPSNKIIWVLEGEGRVPGIDYKDRFEIPVFKTAESGTDAIESKAEKSLSGFKDDLDLTGVETDIKAKPDISGAMAFNFPVAWRVALGGFLFIVVVNLMGALFFATAPKDAAIFLIIFFTVFNLIGLFWFFGSLFVKSITIKSGELITMTKFFSIAVKKRRIKIEKIKELKAVELLQQDNKLYYGIQVITDNDEKYIAGKGLKSFGEASLVIEEIKRCIGSV